CCPCFFDCEVDRNVHPPRELCAVTTPRVMENKDLGVRRGRLTPPIITPPYSPPTSQGGKTKLLPAQVNLTP
ncbi:MAG: hypothetical protein P9M15_03425, partial [Candidatus Electryoneaceae bacterium]|nr:hypothetical protein [Candidatus Electryoneaceae bacterium]